MRQSVAYDVTHDVRKWLLALLCNIFYSAIFSAADFHIIVS